MKIKDMMTTQVHSIHADDNLHSAAALMWEHDCGVLPVMDSKKQVIGMITDRDIAMAAFTQGCKLSEISAKNIISNKLHSCSSEAGLDMAEGIMRENQIRRLPVLNSNNHLVGIVSLNDIALAYKKDQGRKIKSDEVADTLASICIHRQHAAPTAVM